MRIISGDAKGRTLYAPGGAETRPTSDKLRGSLFNILGARVLDARVVDLFGGTGALALEALSRGAAFAAMADTSRAAIAAIERNARNVLGDQIDRRAAVIKADYRSAIAQLPGEPYDLAFLDPPYRMTDAYGDALNRLWSAGRLTGDCLAILERQKQARIVLPEGFQCVDTRIYGDTALDFVTRSSATPET